MKTDDQVRKQVRISADLIAEQLQQLLPALNGKATLPSVRELCSHFHVSNTRCRVRSICLINKGLCGCSPGAGPAYRLLEMMVRKFKTAMFHLRSAFMHELPG